MYPRPADGRLIPMEFNATRTVARFELGEGHARFDGAMYGGTGIAAAVIAMEAATQRPALWATVQFVTSPASGSVLECAIDTLARGKRTAQWTPEGTLVATGGQTANMRFVVDSEEEFATRISAEPARRS